MKKKSTKTIGRRIRDLIAEGKTNKEIIAKLKCDPQRVYNARYYVKNKTTPDQPKRKYVRKETAPVVTPMMTEVEDSPPVQERKEVTRTETPSLFARILRWFD